MVYNYNLFLSYYIYIYFRNNFLFALKSDRFESDKRLRKNGRHIDTFYFLISVAWPWPWRGQTLLDNYRDRYGSRFILEANSKLHLRCILRFKQIYRRVFLISVMDFCTVPDTISVTISPHFRALILQILIN